MKKYLFGSFITTLILFFSICVLWQNEVIAQPMDEFVREKNAELATYSNFALDKFVNILRKDGIDKTFRSYKRHAYQYGYTNAYSEQDGIYIFTYETPIEGTHPIMVIEWEYSYNSMENMARVIISIPALVLRNVAFKENVL